MITKNLTTIHLDKRQWCNVLDRITLEIKRRGYRIVTVPGESEEYGALQFFGGVIEISHKFNRLPYFKRVAILTHELGHAETTNMFKFMSARLYYEYKASEWALQFLSDKLQDDGLVRVARYLADAYQTYVEASDAFLCEEYIGDFIFLYNSKNENSPVYS